MSGASPSGTLVAHLFALALEMVGFWRGHELADYSFQMFHASPRFTITVATALAEHWSMEFGCGSYASGHAPADALRCSIGCICFCLECQVSKGIRITQRSHDGRCDQQPNSYSSPFVRTRYFPKCTLVVLQEPTTPFRSKSLYCSPLRKSLGATASLRHLVSIDAFPVPSFLLCQD